MGREVIFLLGLGILALSASLLMSTWIAKRNVYKVIDIFQENNAIGIHNAKTIEELGLQPKSMLKRMFSRRDWKPKALDLLIQNNVVLMTEDGKLYITEVSLASATGLKLKK